MYGKTIMKPLKIGVIGLGRFGQLHCSKYHDLPTTELVGVYDCDDLLSRATSIDFRCKDFHSSNDLLKEVDAVSIVTPTVTHFEYGRQALLRGVHVFMEKPLATTFAEGEELVALAKEKGLVLQVGHIERFNEALVKHKKLLINPTYVSAIRTCNNNGRCRDVCVVLDLMIHDLDIILSCLGEYDSVEAEGDENKVVAYLTFKDGAIAKLIADREAPFDQRSILFDFQVDPMILVDFHKKSNDALLDEVKDFAGSIKNGVSPQVSGTDGLLALKAAIAIKEGVKNGRSKSESN